MQLDAVFCTYYEERRVLHSKEVVSLKCCLGHRFPRIWPCSPCLLWPWCPKRKVPLREREILVSALLEFVSSRRPRAVNMSVVAGPQSGVEREEPRLVLWEGNRSPSGKVGAEEPEGDEENDVAVSGEGLEPPGRWQVSWWGPGLRPAAHSLPQPPHHLFTKPRIGTAETNRIK